MAVCQACWLSWRCCWQETGPDPEHIYNCHVVLDGGGSMVAAYRKVHLFNVAVHNGPVLMEGRGTAPGQQVGAGQCALRVM